MIMATTARDCLYATFERFLLTGKRDDSLTEGENGVICVYNLLVEQPDLILDKLRLQDYHQLLNYYPLIQTLVTLVVFHDKEVSNAAWEEFVNIICNTPPKFFYFNEMFSRYYASRKRDKQIVHEGGDPEDLVIDRSCMWNRRRCKAVESFLDKSPQLLLYHLTKYKKRYNWNYTLLLRYSHAKFDKNDPLLVQKSLVITYVLHGYKKMCVCAFKKYGMVLPEQDDQNCIDKDNFQPQNGIQNDRIIGYITALENLKHSSADDVEERLQLCAIRVDQLIVDFKEDVNKFDPFHFGWEHVPSQFLTRRGVWEILLNDMPAMALLRNIVRMTKLRLFDNQETVQNVVDKIKEIKIRDERFLFHPMLLLKALVDCKFLRRNIPTARDRPRPLVPGEICNALMNTFFCFKPGVLDITPVNRVMISVDMGRGAYQNQTPYRLEYCAGLMLQLQDLFGVEKCSFYECRIAGLTGLLKDTQLLNRQRDRGIDDMNVLNVDKIQVIKFDKQPKYLWPIEHARSSNAFFDLFIMITDSKLTTASRNVLRKLAEYQTWLTPRINTKLIVVSLYQSTGNDSPGHLNYAIGTRNTMDVSGYDPNLLHIIKTFLSNDIIDCRCCNAQENDELNQQ